MIKFLPGRYCSQLWFVPVPQMECDILGVLFRDAEHWTFVYRIRYDAGTDDPWDGEDRKSWYEFRAALDVPEAALLGDLETKIRAIASGFDMGCEIHILPLRSSDPRHCMEQISAEPWASTRQLKESNRA